MTAQSTERTNDYNTGSAKVALRGFGTVHHRLPILLKDPPID